MSQLVSVDKTKGNRGEECARQLNLLPKVYPVNDFMTFDIESVPIENVRQMANSTAHSYQAVVCIGVTKTFGDRQTAVFVRSDMTESALDVMMQEFVKFLHSASEEFREIYNFDEKLAEVYSLLAASQISPTQKAKLENARHYLATIRKLKVFSYNGEHYDLPVILPALLKNLGDDARKLFTIKRGSGYLTVSSSYFQFVDARNFTAGGSLDAFAKSWEAEGEKLTFPYEHFNDIAEMRQFDHFCPYACFSSSLRVTPSHETIQEQIQKAFASNEVELEEFINILDLTPYITNRTDVGNFDDLTNIEWTDLDKWWVVNPDVYVKSRLYYEAEGYSTMFEYLIGYCKIDIHVLRDALVNYISNFLQVYNTNPLEYLTIPAMAENILWSEYDSTINTPTTIHAKFEHVYSEIKNAIMGGPAIVFDRHVEINSKDTSTYSKTVHFTKSGEQFQHLFELDLNSKCTGLLT